MKEMSALVNYGTRQLEEVFKQDVVNCTGNQIEPLHFITKGIPFLRVPIYLLTFIDKPFPIIPERDVSRLRVINRYMASTTSKGSQISVGEYNTMKIFADIRGNYVARSLTTSSAASLSTARKQNADALYRRGTCGIGAYASSLEGMITAEFDNVKRMFASEDWTRALLLTTRPALNDFGKTLRDLNSHIQANMMTDCFLAYEILDIVSSLARRLDTMTPEMKKAILELLQPVHDTAKSSLSKMIEETKQRVQSLISLPPDGSPLPLTSEIVTRLQHLSEYFSPVTTIMSTIGDGNWASSPPPSSPPSIRSFDTGAGSSEGSQIFAHYCTDSLETLVAQLDSRARLLLKSTGVQNVFMCNNISVIEGMLSTSDLATMLPSIQSRIDMWRSKHVKLYLTSWNIASGQLLDVQYTNRASGRPTSSGVPDSASVVRALSAKERDNIKDKFRVFNAAFDDLVAKHKSYKMEKEVRSLLGREVQRVIEPLYGRFWDRYHEVDKGKGKYVKYSKAELSAMFSGMT
jgi:exocyst complex protein 7